MLLHCRVREGETIQYYDAISLYTYIYKYFNFLWDTRTSCGRQLSRQGSGAAKGGTDEMFDLAAETFVPPSSSISLQ
jgi:hypothetical protein